MDNSRFKLYLIITLTLSGLLPFTGITFLQMFLSGRYWIDEPLHSVVEAIGSFIALSLALLILILQKDKRVPSCYMWISCALIGMGLLDVFHAFSPPGDSFVWLHGMAILIGGFLFSMVWLTERMAQSRLASTLPTAVAVIAIMFGVFAFVFPDTLPLMINKGIFTTTADEINILSGLFFLSAAGYFVIRYRSDRSIEDFLFVNFCLLNGWAGLLFPLSTLWYTDWWFWHLLRLIAYFIVISYVFITFQRSEAMLRESEERYRKLVESSPDAIAVHSEGKIVFTNPAGAKLLGAATPEQLIGKEIMDFVHSDYRELVKGRLQQMKEERKDVPLIEEKLVRLDQSVIDVEVSGTPFIHQGKHGMQVIIRDVTEKKKIEAQFLRSQRLESIGTLAGGIAHDINNVLTPVILSLQILREKFVDNESQKLLDILERSTQRGASLVKQVQSFARGVQGERVALQVSNLISEMSQIAKETFPKSIAIRTDIQKELWTISGDATQLHQVIMNLCVNARDAMPEGGNLSISAENIFIDEDYARMNIDAKVDRYVVITVADTGTGIPPEILDRIFEPFFTTKQPGKGTGLGLSTSLGIVKSHGGFINVYSEAGKGTVFKVYLPAVKTTETRKVDEQLKLLAGHGESILVVDDEAMVREITTSILKTHGYSVLTANDGEEAIEVYKQNREKIKVVLMDMMMPVMDGLACIRTLHEINPDVRIIAVSGFAEKEKLANVAVTQVKAFLPKPYASERLLRTIHEVISAK